MDNDGFAERTAWVSSGDGLLVMDKNGNGKIDNQNELFGNDDTYADGFLNLTQYDSNNDNVMNSADAQWNNLRVWVDANGDGITDAGELKTLTQLNITQINLAATTLTNTFDNENEVGATSTFMMNGQSHQINDIWFRVDQTSSHYTADVTLNVTTLFLPTLKGFGNLKDLHVAMSEDATLLTMVQNFVTNSSTLSFLNNAAFDQQVKNIVFRWAGVDGISPSHTTQGLNTQTMLVLEYLTGYKTSFLNGVPPDQNLGGNFSAVQSVLLSNILQDIKAQLLVQTFGSQLFEKGGYNLATGDYSETPVLSSAGIAKIAADLNGLSSSQKGTYWLGLNTFLKEIKHPSEYTQTEIDGLNTVWSTTSPYGGTWHSYILGYSSQAGWSFNGSNLSDNLIGIENGTNRIWGNGGDDYIQGGVYGDNLEGNDGNDILNGGAGQDMLTGGNGDDTYIIEFNNGPDTIDDSSGCDIIKFGEGYDISQFSMRRGITNNTNMEILFNGQLTATITSYYYPNGQFNLEKVIFADGSFIELDKIANVVNGTTGNDSLNGHNGIDQFHGGTGNDALNGGGGNDVYVMNIGDGIDTVNESSGINDTILMGAGITAGNIRFEKNATLGGDLIIYYNASDKVITSQQFYSEGSPNNYSKQVEFLKLADGTIYNLTNGLTFNGTNGDKTVNGTSMNDILYGLNGNDTLNSANGNDTLNGGTGNDTLQGSAGDDTYVFNIGDGQDTIFADTSGNDTVLMGASITSSNTRFEKSGNDLLIHYGTSDIITLRNHFYDDAGVTNSIDETETLKFANASTINLKSTLTFTGTAVAESVYGTKSADVLVGLAGDDSLTAYEGNDTLNGGTGNDSLQGGAGDDTYVFNIGDGQDTIYTDTGGNDTVLMGSSITSSNIRFEKSGNDLLIRYGTSDIITLRNHFYDDSNGTNVVDEIETLKFANASTINLKGTLTFTGTAVAESVYGTKSADVLVGLAGDDSLTAYEGNDTLNGGTGNDTLQGGAGDDTYVFNIGDGQDTIFADTSGNDTVLMGASITSSNIRFEKSGNDLLIRYGISDIITLRNHFYDDAGGTNSIDEIETLKFSNNSTINLKTGLTFTGTSASDVVYGTNINDILIGLGGDDTLQAGNGDDSLNGGAGNDYLNGQGGIDTLTYVDATAGVTVSLAITTAQNTIGSGTDTIVGIENLIGSAYNDTLIGDSLANNISGGNGNDTIEGGLGNDVLIGGSGIDTVSYAAATSATTVNLSVTAAQNTGSSGTDTISGFENILGSAYNDILTGDGNANTIEGGLGNDTLNGGAGIDTVSYAAATAGVIVNLSLATAQNTGGAGTDTLSNFENIFASAFNDTLTGSSAANTINGGAGDDLIVGGLGADILTGGLGSDTFQFLSTGLDANFDRITDFGTAQANKIDVKNILVGFDAVTSAITNFIEFTTSGANTVVKVDRDGAGTTYGWQQVAQLDNVTGLTDEAALRANGNLIVV